MKAIYYESKGPAAQVLQMGEQPLPEPAAGEVRVRIHVSAVNPSDTKGRGGYRGVTAMPFPLIVPHQDGAGVIDAVGEGVAAARVGQRVWVYEATLGRAFGTCAEYTTVPAHKAVPLPDAADFDAGACMGIPAMTAHRCVLQDGPVRGQTVLVQGGAGAVGFYAIQIAKREGARVIATVSREAQAEQARLAGADHVINYKTEDVVARIKEITGSDAGVDRVVEVAFGANLATDLAVLKTGGVISTYSSDAVHDPAIPIWAMMYKHLTVHFVLVYAMPREAHDEAARYINEALQDGCFKHQIHQRYAFTLDQVVAAHEATESMSHVGKVLITLA
ncbi:MAG: NADPH:quinone reductase [Hylemonella sp.]|nr:NADPH:quinone reductase [Hylemonella sp.]MDH5709557.1 NADPH:quinone reductase [Hylemonella sp.]